MPGAPGAPTWDPYAPDPGPDDGSDDPGVGFAAGGPAFGGGPGGPGDGGDGDDPDDPDGAAHGGDATGLARPTGPALLDDAPRLPTVPGFEGLRALALVAVLLFHQGWDIARGGFLGISSFFTLSGFLLTTLALAEWAQSGHLALGRLWERRARRLVPAYVALLVLVVVLEVVLRVGTGPGFRGDVLWAAGWATNWHAVLANHDPAGIFLDPSPTQHLWALAVLAQLTLVVPLLFVGFMRVAGRRWRLGAVAFAVLAVATFALAHLAANGDGNGGIAYFGTHTRAGELLVGVALAYAVLSPRVRRVLETSAGVAVVRYGSVLALVVLAGLWSRTSLGDPRLFGGITAVNAGLTALVALAVTAPGPAATFLGVTPLRWLGRISYTAFLVHWPLFLLIDEDRIDLPGPALFLVRVAATVVVAAALHLGVERPVRAGLRVGRPQLAGAFVGATAVVAVAALVVPLQPPAGVSLTIGSGGGDEPGQLDVVVPNGTPVASIALVGDELASSIVPGFTAWNENNAEDQVHVDTHVTDGCPPGAPGPVRLAGETVGEQTACVGWEPRLPELLDATSADAVVVVTGIGELGERELDGAWRHIGDPQYDDWLGGQLAELADELAAGGTPVFWATIPHVRMGGAAWTTHDDNDPARVDRYNELVRAAAAGHDQIQVVDMTAWAQELPRGGEFSTDYRPDGVTFTEAGADQAAAFVVRSVVRALD
jgi:peptidoglycan/LPS O-acetylase OafA/YrhL